MEIEKLKQFKITAERRQKRQLPKESRIREIKGK